MGVFASSGVSVIMEDLFLFFFSILVTRIDQHKEFLVMWGDTSFSGRVFTEKYQNFMFKKKKKTFPDVKFVMKAKPSFIYFECWERRGNQCLGAT